MTTARDRGWGDPSAPGYRAKHIVKITAGGRDLYVRREAAHLFQGFIDAITPRYPIDVGPTDDWGFAFRPVRGYEVQYQATKDPKYLSNHSWGLAVDLNARTNPQGTRLVTDIPAWVVEEAERWGLYWGGRYEDRPDAMHFEFLGRPEDVHRYPLPPHQEDDMPDWSETDSKNLAAIEGHLAAIRHEIAGPADKNPRFVRLLVAVEAVKKKLSA